MKKNIWIRGVIGFPLGIALGYLITIAISLGWGNGSYLPCVPELAAQTGGEINAVLFQTLLCGILGTVFSGTSVIWEQEKWSLFWQTFLYFAINAPLMMAVAYAARWMEHSFWGFAIYFGIFLGIFIIIWLIQYRIAKRTVKKMNGKLAHIQRK